MNYYEEIARGIVAANSSSSSNNGITFRVSTITDGKLHWIAEKDGNSSDKPINTRDLVNTIAKITGGASTLGRYYKID